MKITGGTIPLGGATVRPRNMYVSGGPAISGGGFIDPEMLSNGGTIYVKGGEGAATVDSDTGKVAFLPLPPKARRPHRVTIVEWTWGGDARETAYWR